jgi:NAD(P)-dependent dehydrogenase (short-subunit alcohol dehydrogenase family)
MSTDRSNPALSYTLPFQLTKKIHRSVPPGLSPELPENSAKGKIVVITGGGTGIGAAAARVWVRAGAAGVVVTGRRKEKLNETVRSTDVLNKDGTSKVLGIVADLKVEAEVEALFREVNEIFGRPADVVIANAAQLSENLSLADEDVTTWWSVWVSRSGYDLNFYSKMLTE